MSISAPRRSGPLWAALACAVAGGGLFHFFGNATRGYIDTSSTFVWWIRQWLDPASETEHGWLILALSGWLLARNLRAKGRTQPAVGSDTLKSESASPLRPMPGAGAKRSNFRLCAAIDGVAVAAMLAALALHVLGFVAQQTRLSIMALLLFTWGVLRLGGGRRWGDAAMFPLGFLVFALPLNVLDSIGFWLRLWVVDAAGVFARIADIGLVRSGTQLFAPDGSYQYDVAAACSGVRSLLALAALSLLIGYLRFRSPWRRALLLALCFPLTYLGNLGRIVAILVAAQLGGQTWGERAHDVMGFGVFVIVLGGALGAAALLQRGWPEPAGGAGPDTTRGPAGGDRAWPKALAAGAIVVFAAAEMILLAHVSARPAAAEAGVRLATDGKNPVELPAFLGTEWVGRRAEVTAVERQVLPADTGFARRHYVSLRDGAHGVLFSIVLSGRDRTSIHRPELCLVGQGWTIQARSRRTLAGAEGLRLPVTMLQTESVGRDGRKLPALTAYWFVSREATVATHWERVLSDAWQRVRHGRADRWAYVLMQTDATDGEAAALARLEAVLAGVWPQVGKR